MAGIAEEKDLGADASNYTTSGKYFAFVLHNVFVQFLGDAGKVGTKFLIALTVEVVLNPFQFGF